MSLSITCVCGARLEIDEKFAGQVIPCPDCQRPLNTAPPAPDPARTSGFALASLTLALIGAFTILGTIAAVVCGVIALKQIRRTPADIGGKGYAQAGIALGVGFTLATLVALWTAELLRLDGYLRTIEWAGKVEYGAAEIVSSKSNDFDAARSMVSMHRPSPAWGLLTFKYPNTGPDESDDLVLVNLWEDAYLLCVTKKNLDVGMTLEACRQEGQERFLQAELIKRILGRTAPNSPPLAGQDRDRKQLPGTETQEFLFDIRLRGVDRTFLVRVQRDGTQLKVSAGGTRKSRFARLQPEFVKALDSYKVEK